MSRHMQARDALPGELRDVIVKLGAGVRVARKRRRLTMDQMASRMFVTRKTLSRLEHGDPGVSLAVFTSALWVLGLDHELSGVAVPEQDEVGLYRERQLLPKRVRGAGTAVEPDF